MSYPKKIAILLFSMLVAVPLADGAERSSTQRARFMKKVPCPETGQPRGPCPGWVVDHIEPLCAGGADHRSNMQWQTIDEAKRKDRIEKAVCSRNRVSAPKTDTTN